MSYLVKYKEDYIPENTEKNLHNLLIYGRASLFEDDGSNIDSALILSELKKQTRDYCTQISILKADRDYYYLTGYFLDDDGSVLERAHLAHWQFAFEIRNFSKDEFELYQLSLLDDYIRLHQDRINKKRIQNLSV